MGAFAIDLFQQVSGIGRYKPFGFTLFESLLIFLLYATYLEAVLQAFTDTFGRE